MELLETTSLSYSYISALPGYTDIGHFCKQFRQYYGTTPKQYRAGIQSPVPPEKA